MGNPEEKERLKGTQGQNKSIVMREGVTGKSPAVSTNCKEGKKVKLTCLLFAGLNALLFLLLVLTIIYMTKDLSIEIEQTADLCVNCSYLVIHPDDELTGVSRRDDGLCCVEGDQNIYDLVHMYAGRWMKKNLAESNPTYNKYKCGPENETATIKVVGRRAKQENVHHRKVLWDSDSELAILPEDKYMTHHHEQGFIEIKRPGLYFVYSQLVLEHDGPGRVEELVKGPLMYHHSVQLFKPGIEKQANARSILSNKNTRCPSTKDKYSFTSYIGSVFQLYDGDRLFVVVNDVREVVSDPHMNHFGVHRL